VGGDLSAFAVATNTADLGANAIALPMIIAPESMQSYLGSPIFPHEISWRITLNTSASAQLWPRPSTRLTNFRHSLQLSGAQASTGLLRILADSLVRLSACGWRSGCSPPRLWPCAICADDVHVLHRRPLRAEVATLNARGASAWQITQVFALENLILALPAALLLGPGLAQVALALWAQISGELLPGRLSGELWLLAALAAAVGWLALVVPIYWAARRCGHEPQPARARPPQQSMLHKRYVDLYLLAFAGCWSGN